MNVSPLRGEKNTWGLKIYFLFKNETFSPLNREEVKNSDNLNPTFLNSASPSQSPEMHNQGLVVGYGMLIDTTTLPYGLILSKDTLWLSRFSSKCYFCHKKFFKTPPTYVFKVKYPRRIFYNMLCFLKEQKTFPLLQVRSLRACDLNWHQRN